MNTETLDAAWDSFRAAIKVGDEEAVLLAARHIIKFDKLESNRSSLMDDLAFRINSFVAIAYGESFDRGWWDDCNDNNEYLVIPTKLALIHSEISEALEGYRKDLMDDHLTDRKMIEVELADALIRIGDLAGRLDLDLGGATIAKIRFNATREDHNLSARTALGGKKF